MKQKEALIIEIQQNREIDNQLVKYYFNMFEQQNKKGIDLYQWLIDCQPIFSEQFHTDSLKIQYFQQNMQLVISTILKRSNINEKKQFSDFLFDISDLFQSVKFPLLHKQVHQSIKVHQPRLTPIIQQKTIVTKPTIKLIQNLTGSLSQNKIQIESIKESPASMNSMPISLPGKLNNLKNTNFASDLDKRITSKKTNNLNGNQEIQKEQIHHSNNGNNIFMKHHKSLKQKQASRISNDLDKKQQKRLRGLFNKLAECFEMPERRHRLLDQIKNELNDQ